VRSRNAAPVADDPLVQELKRLGIPVTRESWIGLNWGADAPDADHWTFEEENQIPAELQDWSKVRAEK
jgi:hypothetical protein